mgnify:CR=1 FL=1|jgi:hypothetical protein
MSPSPQRRERVRTTAPVTGDGSSVIETDAFAPNPDALNGIHQR